MWCHESKAVVKTAKEFEDFRFSFSSYPTLSYRTFLRSFLPPEEEEESVLTHGDIAPRNIIVDCDANGWFSVTGIIDWEDSGFYPASFESTKILYTFTESSEDDWYMYVPPCIAPASNPAGWMVHRLWDKACT